MGYEFRLIPPDYEPPRNGRGVVQPQIDVSYRIAKERFERNDALWRAGCHPAQPTDEPCSYEEWDGGLAPSEYYRPDWDPESATSICLYENVTEGTPENDVPRFASEEEALDWMDENWGGTRKANQARLLTDLAKSVHGERVGSMFARALRANPEEMSHRIAFMIRDQDERMLQLDADTIAAALEYADHDKRLDMIRLLRTIDPARFGGEQKRETPSTPGRRR